MKFRSVGDPVLYLSNPPGARRRGPAADARRPGPAQRRSSTDEFGDPEIATRIAQYELAYRMQTSVPELTDLSDEPESRLRAVRPRRRARPGTYRRQLPAGPPAGRARRAVHPALPSRLGPAHAPARRRSPASAATPTSPPRRWSRDLKQRGLLDDTLVVWGGEFGRTVYCQGTLTADDYGRDHHPRCFTVWLAGGGIKPGITHGETDDFGYNIVRDPVHVHDLHATILHCLGIDHTRLTYKFQGRDYRLTDVHGEVVKKILA